MGGDRDRLRPKIVEGDAGGVQAQIPVPVPVDRQRLVEGAEAAAQRARKGEAGDENLVVATDRLGAGRSRERDGFDDPHLVVDDDDVARGERRGLSSGDRRAHRREIGLRAPAVVVVEEGDDLAARQRNAEIARANLTRLGVVGAAQAALGAEPVGDELGRADAVVDDDDLVVVEILAQDRSDRFGEHGVAVLGRNDDRDRRRSTWHGALSRLRRRGRRGRVEDSGFAAAVKGGREGRSAGAPIGGAEFAVVFGDAVVPQPARLQMLDARNAAGQIERLDQAFDLAPRRGLRVAEAGPRVLDRIERGEPDRKQFAEDDAIVQPVGDAEPQLARQARNAEGDLARVVAGDRRHAVAHHHPVDDSVVDNSPLAPRLHHQVGVLGDRAALRTVVVDAREHVDVDEAVVERRNQRVGQRMGEPHQIGIVGRRVDDDELVVVLDGADRLGEQRELMRLVGAHVVGFAAPHRAMARQLDRPRGVARPRTAILEEAGQRLLAGVEVDAGDLAAGLEQRHREMDRDRRFARAALLVADHDDVRAAEIGGVVVKVHGGESSSLVVGRT